MPSSSRPWAPACALALVLSVAPSAARAATFVVTTTLDFPRHPSADACDCRSTARTGACTLRAAVQTANACPGADVVRLGTATYLLSQSGTFEDAGQTGDLDVHEELTIVGEGIERTFIDASDETLLKRFSETRRKHPLSTVDFALADAIERERVLLDPLTRRADLRLDTTHMNVHQLRNTIRELVSGRAVGTMALQLRSFGFKNGVPADADFVFDMRALPNPYWEMELRDLSGRDGPVREYLEASPLVGEMVADITRFLDAWVPRFEAVNRSYLTVAFGCTGGRHRSVYMVETVARHFAAQGRKAVVSHRDS